MEKVECHFLNAQLMKQDLVKWLHVSAPHPGHHQAIPQPESGKIINNCEY